MKHVVYIIIGPLISVVQGIPTKMQKTIPDSTIIVSHELKLCRSSFDISSYLPRVWPRTIHDRGMR